jgi:hypothetical protein
MDARAILCTTNGESMKHCPQCSTGYPDSLAACPTHGLPLNEIRDLKPGMVIHHSYRIVRKLGQGGMGAVYLAQHTLMDEPRALKFLSAELSQDQAFTARFLREVRTLRQIRHPNVVDCGDLESAEDGSLFFSMEFVDGPDLRAFLRDAPKYFESGSGGDTEGGGGFNPRIYQPITERALAPEEIGVKGTGFSPYMEANRSDGVLTPAGALPVELALHLTRQIAHGLAAAHARGMVHRDIKPENILLARDGSGWQPKIADFGIVATKESSSVFTRTGGTLLTVAYAAPEQWRGTPAAELDGRTDLYALGGLLYEMLTGQTAFHAESYEGWARQHQTTPPQPPSTLRPDLANWQGLDALVLRLLAKDCEDRPKDVAELVDLLYAVRLAPSEARRETVAEPLRSRATELCRGKSLGRVPRWALSASAALLVFIIALVGTALSFKPATISTRAGILDNKRHYNLGGMLRKLACMRGDAGSCNALADMYYKEEGVKQNMSRAHELYLHAAALYLPECTGGSADACSNLAGLYEDGKGVEKNASRADFLYKQGIEFNTEKCNTGDKEICARLGLYYSVGSYPFQKDYVKAAELYAKACNLGEAYWGCIQLSTAYELGNGVPKNIEQAINFDIKGCDLGEPYGCWEAGTFYDLGEYLPPDYARAAALYSRACNGGNDLGCDYLGNLYRDGNGVPQDSVKAKYYYSKSCLSASNLHYGCDELTKLAGGTGAGKGEHNH